MAMNFGPINREGGARRLNVAVTRARYSLKLVASIEPEDIDLTHSNSQGAALLRNYLEVAREGVRAVYKDERVSSDTEFESPFEQNVNQELSRRGLQLKPQVGVSNYRIDFGVMDPEQPGRFLLGIECDGAAYHAAFTARDRDRLRQQILEGLGWKIHRIWSRDWIQNREGEIQRVMAAVNARKQALSNPSLNGKKKLNLNQKAESIEALAMEEPVPLAVDVPIPPRATPYIRTRLPLRRLAAGRSILEVEISNLADAFAKVVEIDGPIATESAKRRIAEAWQTRIGTRINSHLDNAIRLAERQKKLVIRNSFLWPLGVTKVQLRVSINSKAVRPLQEIPPEEIMLAIQECVTGAVGIERNDLAREVCRLFGLKGTDDHLSLINYYVEELISNNFLISKNGKVMREKNL